MALRGSDKDDLLFRRFRRTGDPRALGRLFDRTAPALLKVALFLSRDRGRAEELVQRTFLAAIERREAFDDRRPVLPWLLGILTNHARRQVREERRHVPLVDRAAPTLDPSTSAEERELREALAAVRESIHDPYRQVLELHLDHGLASAEIARVLRRPAGTVRTQIARGLEQLRKRLPRGFVAGVAVAAALRSDLAAMRAAVLARVPASTTGVGAAAGAGALVIGGMVMTEKTILAAGAALMVLALSVVWSLGAFDAPPPPATREGGALTVAAAAAEPVAEAAAAPASPAARTAIPPAAAPSPTTAVLRLRIRWKHDRSPAVSVGVRVITWDGPNPFLHEQSALSDAAGECRFDGLRPGQAGVYLALGGSESLTLEPGEDRTLELTVERFATAAGVVVDPDGTPVEDARIWLSWESSGSSGFEVARTAADGRFAVPVGRNHTIGARKTGRQPSLLRDVTPREPGAVLAFRLDLRSPSAMLAGIVHGPDGRPLPSAQVMVGSEHSWDVSSTNDEERMCEPAGLRLVTGGDGRFATSEILPGRVTVAVRAAGCAPWSMPVDVSAATPVELPITLLAGATVRGRVLDAAGAPVSGAEITFGRYAEFDARRATAAADGSFELDSLPVGSVTLRAAQREAGKTSASLTLAAGSVTCWNPVLKRSAGIGGRVVGEAGQPLPGLHVAAIDPTQPWSWARSIVTGADGAFELPNLELPEYTLRVLAPSDTFTPLLERVRVRTGSSGVELRLLAEHRPSTRLRGRVLDPDGKPEDRARIVVFRPGDNGGRVFELADDGTFELGPWPAGLYELTVDVPGRSALPLGLVRLEPEQDRDLGTVRLEPPGSLAVAVHDAAGEPVPNGFITLTSETGTPCGGMQIDQGAARLERVPPGRYLVQHHARDGGVAAAMAEVRSGIETSALLATTVGVRCRIEVQGEGGAAALGLGRVLVRDAAGQPVRLVMVQGQTGSHTAELTLPPGHYDVECLVRGSRTGRTPIDVTTAAGPQSFAVAVQ